MKRQLFVYFLVLLAGFFLLLSVSTLSVIQSSPLAQFNISYENVTALNSTTLNYTNSYRVNLSIIIANSSWDNITLTVLNDTSAYPDSGLGQNYTQGDARAICAKIPLQILLPDGTYNNTFVARNSTSQNITIIHTHSECFPGKYYTTKLAIRNYAQTNESANVTVYLDIPISPSNTLNSLTGIGNFSGSMPINATSYHSYYFNATSATDSAVANATTFVINTTSSADIDVFLFDSSRNFRAKSINKTHGNEYLIYMPLPTALEMWEIRVYGNSTSVITYSGNLLFATLNSTNTSLNFGTLNATRNLTVDYTLSNIGNISINSLREEKELYRVTRLGGNNNAGAKNYSLFVPDSSTITKVKVSLNWTGGANYSMNIYDSTNSLVAHSKNRYVFANVSGADQEEYNETTSLSSTGNYWNIEVVNNSNVIDAYNITAYLYFNPSNWITTNFTTLDLNTTNTNNSTTDIHLNFSTPAGSVNGTYEGKIKYLDRNNAGMSIPINFDVVAPMAVINGTISKDRSSKVYTFHENYGVNGSKIIFFNVTNLGFYTLDLNFTNTTGNFTCYSGVCGLHFPTFTMNASSNVSLDKNDNAWFTVNISFNSTLPVSTAYSASLYINATSNTTGNLSSHPYSDLFINLIFNVTNAVDVRVFNVSSEDRMDRTVNASKPENITIALDIYSINGSSSFADLLITNFTGVWLQERNLTSSLGRIPSVGNLSFYAGSSPFYCNGSCPFSGDYHYFLSATIPTNTTGGIYDVYVNLTDVSPYDYSGIGMNRSVPVIVNSSGLHMSSMNGTSISMSNASTYLFAVNVTNYGPLAPLTRGFTSTITFNESCAGYTVTAGPLYANCPSASFDPAGYNSSCVAYWTITAADSNYSACTAYIVGTPSYMWFNPNGANISIDVTKSSGTTTSTTGQTTTDTTVANLAFTSVPTLITVQQNSTNTTTVQVKNTGTKIQSVSFTILDLNSSWWSANLSTPKILDVNKLIGYMVTFNVGNAEVKDYNIAFKTYSSEKSVTSNFTLRVTPAPAKQIEINNTFYDYLSNFTKLGEEINKTKAQGINVTNSSKKYSLVKEKVDLAQTYANSNDYFNLNQLLSTIKLLLDDAWATLNQDKITGRSAGIPGILTGRLIYILIAVGAVAAGVVAYLFWPTKITGKESKGYLHEKNVKTELVVSKAEKKTDISDKLKENFDKLKEKLSPSKKEKAEYKGY